MVIFQPEFIPSSIVVIGGGGTGSRLMPGLAQLVRTQIRKYNPLAFRLNIPIYVVDGDVVEEKNLMRQHFVRQDVGRNKAVVLAERYSVGFGVPITPIPYYLNEDTATVSKEVRDFLSAINSGALIIFAVDSAKARRDILSVLMKYTQLMCANGTKDTESKASPTHGFLIDAGNEDDFGQVRISSLVPAFLPHSAYTEEGRRQIIDSRMKGHPKRHLATATISQIPLDLAYYYSLGESAQERSCEELPQTLAINQLMGTFILSFVQNLLLLKPMTYDLVRVSLKDGVSSQPLTARYILEKFTCGHPNTPHPTNNLWDSVRQVYRASGGTGRISSTEGKHLITTFNLMRDESIRKYAEMGLELDENGEIKSPPPAVPTPSTAETSPVAKEEDPLAIKKPAIKRVRRPSPGAEAVETDDSRSDDTIPATIPPLVRVAG